MINHPKQALLNEDLIHRPSENALGVDKSGFDSFIGKLTSHISMEELYLPNSRAALLLPCFEVINKT